MIKITLFSRKNRKNRADEIIRGNRDVLFERLCNLRNKTAFWQRVYPQDVFTDEELQMMCELMPQRIKDLNLLTGVRKRKIERYGLRFLAEIRVYGEPTVQKEGCVSNRDK